MLGPDKMTTLVFCIIIAVISVFCIICIVSTNETSNIEFERTPIRVSLIERDDVDVCILNSVPKTKKNLILVDSYYINISDNVDVFTMDDIEKYSIFHIMKDGQLLTIVISEPDADVNDRNKAFKLINNSLFQMTHLFSQNSVIIIDPNMPATRGVDKFKYLRLVGDFKTSNLIEMVQSSKHNILPLLQVINTDNKQIVLGNADVVPTAPELSLADESEDTMLELQQQVEPTEGPSYENFDAFTRGDAHFYKDIKLNAIFIRNKPSRLKAIYQSLKGIVGR